VAYEAPPPRAKGRMVADAAELVSQLRTRGVIK